LSVARTILIVIGAVLSILGTYVIALYGGGPFVASGIGFFTNTFVGGFFGLPFIADPATYAAAAGIEVWLFFVILGVFLVFLVAGFLQLVGLKSKVVGAIFSLIPLGVGVFFLLLFYTEILGGISGTFALFFIGEQIGGFIPIMIDIGDGIGLGAFVLVGGGALGFVGSLLPKD